MRSPPAAFFFPANASPNRAHAHIETKRREPWLFEDAARDQIKAAVVMRYTLLPYLYTLFKASEDTGAPILRPIFFEFEDEEDSFEEDAIFLFGDKILVAPVLETLVQVQGTIGFRSCNALF